MRSRYRRGLLDGTTRQRAREVRKNPTAAEKLLWAQLRRQNLGVRFRRQYPILGFFPDFCCLERGLIIEIDGDSHAERSQYDAWRTEQLAQHGFQVLRFFNDEVGTNLDGVMETIWQALQTPALTLPSTPIIAFPHVKQWGKGQEEGAKPFAMNAAPRPVSLRYCAHAHIPVLR